MKERKKERKKAFLSKINLKKYFTKHNIFSAFCYILFAALYAATEYASRTVSVSTAMFTIMNHKLPVASLAAATTSLSTIILICWVLYFHKIGFYTSILILVRRSWRLINGLLHFNFTSFPGLFLTIVAFIAVVLVYVQNEKIRKFQLKYNEDLKDFTKEIIGAFAVCIDGKDPYTNGHSRRVAYYTKWLSQKLGEPKETVDQFYNIALLHDIGKIGIPESILTKPGKLTEEEFDLMKSHPTRGYEILKNVSIQEDIAEGAHYHHERFDGKGYPDGIAGHDIPWVARIIAVADAFDAMSTNRPYRTKLPMAKIVEEMKNNSGTQFDPTVVKAFLDLYNEGAFSALE